MLDKHQRILGAAARLIVNNGLQCSMAAIAEEAGVATGSLYNYFKSKEDLVLGVYAQVSAEMAERLMVPPNPAFSPGEEVSRYIERYIDFIWEDAERARLFDYLDNNPLISPDGAETVFGAFVQHGIDMIEKAQAEGVVRAGTATVITSFLRGSIRNSLRRRRMNGPELAPADRQLIVDMCWAAVRA